MMFEWDKSIKLIDVNANQVVHLFRSMREVQLALPGISAQQASAYLCQYQQGDGVATVAVFHLHKSEVLAFYFAEPRVVSEGEVDSMLDQGLNFVESMGFLLTDQDIHLLDADDQNMLWESLPLKAGAPEKIEESVPAEPARVNEQEATQSSPEIEQEPESLESKPEFSFDDDTDKVEQETADVSEKNQDNVETSDDKDDATESVDDLLAAVEAMRAKRPGLRARKVAPTVEEMNRRKDQLRENVGRILVSL